MADGGVHPALEVLEGKTDGWLHVLHRVKAGRDVFLVCNQNHQGPARRFTLRAAAAGEPECWDAMRNEITALPVRHIDRNRVEFSLSMEPLETLMLVFQPENLSEKIARPMRIEPGATPLREPIALVREPNSPTKVLTPKEEDRPLGAMGNRPAWRGAPTRKGGPLTVSPVAAADPFRGHFTLPADGEMDPAKCHVYLEMEGLPDDSAAVTVNGLFAGGVIGRPSRLDIGRHLKIGLNTLVIEPLAPKSARLVFLR